MLTLNWVIIQLSISKTRCSPPKMFLGKCVLKIWIIFTGEQPYQSVISIELLCNFIEITLRCECSPVHLLHVLRTTFPKNISGGLLLQNSHFKRSVKTVFQTSFKYVHRVHLGDQSLRSSHCRVLHESGVLKIFARCTQNHLFRSLHLIKLHGEGTDY